MDNTLNDTIPELKIEMMNDGIGQGLILLEQDSCGNIDRVSIHPIQLRFMAEQCGLIESSDPQAQKTINALQRKLKRLHDRIDHLAQCLHSVGKVLDINDLSYEQNYAMATADIASEYCFEFDEALQSTTNLN